MESEIGSGEECTLIEKNIYSEYQNLKKQEYIVGIQNLPDTIPKVDSILKINTEELITAEFKWEKKEKLVVTLYYDGAITEINLEQANRNLKRSIYHSADL